MTDDDLAGLPAPVAEYVRRSGAVGQPRIANFRAQIHGRIRGAADAPWMTFVGEQVNTYGPEPARLFFLDATMSGVPTDVLHSFVGPTARMRVKVCSLVTMVDVTGPEMNRGETVTLLNDLCLFAPAALVDAPIEWEPIDDHHVGASFTNGAETVRAGHWHAPEPEGDFAYFEVEIDDIDYNLTADMAPQDRTPSPSTASAHPVTPTGRHQT